MSLHAIVKQLEFKTRIERQTIIQRLLDEKGIPYTLQQVPHEELEAYNIIVTFNDQSSKRLVIGAHYDPYPDSGGANDNGSGVAILVALAEYFLQQQKINCRIDLIFFLWEESGLIGSKFYVNNINPEKIIGMINLDMCGTGDMVIFDHKNRHGDLLPKMCGKICSDLSINCCPLVRIPPGDDYSFEKKGISTISLAIIPSNLTGFLKRIAIISHPTTPVWRKLLILPTVIIGVLHPPPLIAVMHKPSDVADLVSEQALDTVYRVSVHLINSLTSLEE